MNPHFLLSESVYRECTAGRATFVFDADKYQAFIERNSGPGGEQLFLVSEGVARIPVVGVLTKQSDFFLDFMMGGSAVYGDIQRALAAADGDESVKEIVLEIDSPGGDVAGFFETVQAIAATKKPVRAQVTDQALSAAYGLAAATDSITVNNPMATVGSIGVVTSRFVGENRVDITSSAAPKKRPDASTDEGVAAIREELDAIHAEFAGIIARGRGVSVKTVNSKFGEGGNLLAKDALQAGMIDAIKSESSGVTAKTGATKTTAQEFDKMTLDEFKAQHPDHYRACVAEGHALGVSTERDRVAAHLEAGKANGCLELSAEFIGDGSQFSGQLVQARYMTEGRKHTDLADRTDDNPDTGNGAAGKTGETNPDKPSDDAQAIAIFGEVNSALGLSPKL